MCWGKNTDSLSLWSTSFPKKPQETKIHGLYMWKMFVDPPSLRLGHTSALRQCYCAKSCLDLKMGLQLTSIAWTQKGTSGFYLRSLSLKQTVENSWFLIMETSGFAVPHTNPAMMSWWHPVQHEPHRSTVDHQRHTLGLGSLGRSWNRCWSRSWNRGLGNHHGTRRPLSKHSVCCVLIITYLKQKLKSFFWDFPIPDLK